LRNAVDVLHFDLNQGFIGSRSLSWIAVTDDCGAIHNNTLPTDCPKEHAMTGIPNQYAAITSAVSHRHAANALAAFDEFSASP
jgi:hypothetical protein